MKPWLILVCVIASVLLMIGALRGRPTLAPSQTLQSVSDLQPSLEKHRAASSGGSITSDRLRGSAQTDESSVAAKAALLEGLPDGDQQHDLARELLTKLFEKEPASAAELVAALHEPLNMQMAAALASMWVEKDPRNAVQWATNLPPSPARTHALLSLCADWAAVDPKSAATFLFNAPAADFPINENASSATASAANSSATDVRSQMLFIIGSRWAVQKSSEALGWVGQSANGPDRDSLVSGMASSLAERSPSDAATLVASMSPGQQQNDAALTVLLEWGHSDPQAAANWLKLFPSGEFRDKAILNLTATLAELEPDSAKGILLDWPEPAERDHAIRHYLNATLGTDASRGVSVLADLEDNAIFQEETERVAQHWLMQEPSAALEWLADTSLDDSTKLRLLSAPGLTLRTLF